MHTVTVTVAATHTCTYKHAWVVDVCDTKIRATCKLQVQTEEEPPKPFKLIVDNSKVSSSTLSTS